VKAWNYHNEIASKRQLWTKDALICLKEFVKFRGAVTCSACDPKNEGIYAESLHVNTESAKPMLKACVLWFQSFKYLVRMSKYTFEYAIHVTGSKMRQKEREYMMENRETDLVGCEAAEKEARTLVTPKSETKRVLQAVTPTPSKTPETPTPSKTPETPTPSKTPETTQVTVDNWTAWIDAPFKPYQDWKVVADADCAKNELVRLFVSDMLGYSIPEFLVKNMKPVFVGYYGSMVAGATAFAIEQYIGFEGDILPSKSVDLNRILQATTPVTPAATTPVTPAAATPKVFPPTWIISEKGLKLDAYKNSGIKQITALEGRNQKDLAQSSL
jgi:hypothetical protein